ncbi:MAG: HAD family hydrolase [Solirubrobacteraceae bacterium]|nr:HAD family hydrolase [Solirubrobacteraceae bacterium]
MSRPRLVLLDRDGTINVKAPEGEYVLSVEDLELLPGAAEAVGELTAANLPVRVVTNQRCISRGLLDDEGLGAIHRELVRLLDAAGGQVDEILVCPHGHGECECRKPLPGMLLAAAEHAGVSPADTVMIGDADSDIEAGRAAGMRTIQITSAAASGADAIAPTLLDAVRRHVLGAST